MDATGFETRHISVHFVRRRGMRPHWRCRWPKLTICGLNDSHLIAAATVTKGPTNDSPELPPLVRQAARRVELAGVLADAAFDAEHHHRLCREELGIPFTAIPVNRRTRVKLLRDLAERHFASDRVYTEHEVNETLAAEYHDPLQLRRDLIDELLLERNLGGSDYRRREAPPL